MWYRFSRTWRKKTPAHYNANTRVQATGSWSLYFRFGANPLSQHRKLEPFLPSDCMTAAQELQCESVQTNPNVTAVMRYRFSRKRKKKTPAIAANISSMTRMPSDADGMHSSWLRVQDSGFRLESVGCRIQEFRGLGAWVWRSLGVRRKRK